MNIGLSAVVYKYMFMIHQAENLKNESSFTCKNVNYKLLKVYGNLYGPELYTKGLCVVQSIVAESHV